MEAGARRKAPLDDPICGPHLDQCKIAVDLSGCRIAEYLAEVSDRVERCPRRVEEEGHPALAGLELGGATEQAALVHGHSRR